MNHTLLTFVFALFSALCVNAQITVISPNGGEVWNNGPATNQIIFQNDGGEIYYQVYYSPDSGTQWQSIAYNHGSNGVNEVDIYFQLPVSDHARIRVEEYGNSANSDESDDDFSVLPVEFFLYYPEENDIIYHGEDIYVQWTTSNSNPVNIDFSDNNGISWIPVVSSLNSYYYSFPAPLVNSNHCYIRISDANHPEISSLSSSFSVLSPPQISVNDPNGGEVWVYGESYPVSWTGQNLGSYVAIRFSHDGGNSWINFGEAATSSTGGSTTIQAPWLGTSNARIRVSDYYYGDEGDMSDNDFTVLVPDYIVYHPYEGDFYYTNEPFSVDWHAAQPSESDIAISLDNGATFETIQTNIPASQTYAWVTAPSEPTSHCIFRVSNSNDPSSFGLSPAFSVLQSAQLVLQFPSGGEVLDNDSIYTITWDHLNNLPGWSFVQVEFSADSGINWTSIGWLDETETSMEWTTPHETSPNCLIRIKDPYSTYVNDISNIFAIEDFPNLEICLVTVDSLSGKNKITWQPAPNTIIHDFVILKEGNQADEFDVIGSVPAGSPTEFIDLSSNPEDKASRYKLTFSDAQGNIFSAGDYHQTIHLSISKGINENTWNLSWNHYLGKPIISYNIFRGLSPRDMQMINTLSGNFTTYTDHNAPVGFVYYLIELITEDCSIPSSRGFDQSLIAFLSSRSNIATNFTVGFEEFVIADNFTIYPNPAENTIRIISSGNNELYIYSSQGMLIDVIKITSNVQTVDVSHLSKGVYFVKAFGRVERLIVK